MKAPRALSWNHALGAGILLGTVTAAVMVSRQVLEATGGEPAVPLDDSFIHFNYARSFARFEPLVYSPGAPPTSGATSLLWVLCLAPFWLVGARDLSLVWVAWGLGWLSLGLLCLECHRAARGLLSRPGALVAGLLPLSFGPLAWFAASGMEVLPLAWLLMRSARLSAEWWEKPGSRPAWELAVTGAAAALLRPEGALAAGLVALALTRHSRGTSRKWALLALAGPLLPMALNLALTGQALSATAEAKLIHTSPYATWANSWSQIKGNLTLLCTTLLDGRKWSAHLFPEGYFWVPLTGLAALLARGAQTKHLPRALFILVVAAGALIPTAYYTFLVNRLRYLWPFAGAWLIGLIALPDLLGSLTRRMHRHAPMVVTLTGSVFFAAALGKHWQPTIDDLVTSSSAIHGQQVSLARWAKQSLPAGSAIGVNDAGAIAYLSGHPTVDLVGLTSRGFARPWRAGPGPRFEYWEGLPREQLPPYLIMYPTWLSAEALLGKKLTERTIWGASILGAPTMAAHEANWDVLGSGRLPSTARGRVVDFLDVADLESEASHGYEMVFAHEGTSDVRQLGTVVDGARTYRSREAFFLNVVPGGRLVARLGSTAPVRLTVTVDDREAGEIALTGRAVEEHSLEIPGILAPAKSRIVLTRQGSEWFSSLHYWFVE